MGCLARRQSLSSHRSPFLFALLVHWTPDARRQTSIRGDSVSSAVVSTLRRIWQPGGCRLDLLHVLGRNTRGRTEQLPFACDLRLPAASPFERGQPTQPLARFGDLTNAARQRGKHQLGVNIPGVVLEEAVQSQFG